MSDNEKEGELQNEKPEKLEWRRFCREMVDTAGKTGIAAIGNTAEMTVVVRGHGLSTEVMIGGRSVNGQGFIPKEVRPGEILACIYYDGRDHYGVVRLKGQGPGLSTFIPNPVEYPVEY